MTRPAGPARVRAWWMRAVCPRWTPSKLPMEMMVCRVIEHTVLSVMDEGQRACGIGSDGRCGGVVGGER